MMPREYFRKLTECYLRSRNNRNAELKLDNPIISFTFDDFPISAYEMAGGILEEFDARGTYYASMGLMGCKTDNMGEHFTSDCLSDMLEKGHEIGCHTYSHLSFKDVSFEEYISDINRNKRAMEDLVGESELLNFSFPYGRVSLKSKQATGNCFKTSRGNFPGINNATIDLNLLRANKLYSSSISLKENINLINFNKLSRGWLIFYTHDVRSSPSPWGCTPQYFSAVVDEAVNSGADVLIIRDAYKRIC